MGISDIKKISKKTLTEGIVRPRLNEIFTMVRLELERERILQRIPSGAIITGGGAKTIGATDSAKRMMSLPVRIGVPKGVTGLIDDVIDPIFATTLGLLIYGSKHEISETSGFKMTTKLKISKGSFGFANKIIEAIKDLLP